MSINSIGNNDPLEIKRRENAAQRERDLANTEERYKEEVKNLTNTRANQLQQIQNNQQQEISEAQNEAESKIGRAKEATDAKLHRYHEEVNRLTAHAGKQFREKATQLSQMETEMKYQENQLNERHRNALKAIKEQTGRNEELEKSKTTREMQTLSAHYDNALEETRTKGKADVIRTQKEVEEERAKAFMEGHAQVDRIRSQQKRLAEEGQAAEFNEKQRLQSSLESERKQYHGKYEQELKHNIQSLSNQRDQYNKAMTKMKNDAEFQVIKTKNYYNDTLYDVEKQNEKKIKDSHDKTNIVVQRLTKAEEDQKFQLERIHSKHIDDIQGKQYKMLEDGLRQNALLKEKIDNEYMQQGAMLRNKRRAAVENEVKTIDHELKNIQALGDKQIVDTKLSTMSSVSNFQSKSSDPFYRLQSLQTEIVQDEKNAVLMIKVPEYEHENIRVTFNKGSFTVAGNRRFESNVNAENDHKISSHSFQSYSETVPVQGQYDLRRQVRTYENGVLKITVPRV